MDSVLVLPYSEYVCASELSRILRVKDGYSVYAPLSRQEKGVDLLVCRTLSERRTAATFQIKASRTYQSEIPKRQSTIRYRYNTWFNRFDVSDRADFYLLVGIYPGDTGLTKRRIRKEWWQTLILMFTNAEMRTFMTNVKTQKGGDDEMFGFGFSSDREVILTRGDASRSGTNYAHRLLRHRTSDLKHALSL